MLDSLYELALKRRKNIFKKAKENMGGFGDECVDFWVDFEIKEKKFSGVIGALDGSYNSKSFIDVVLYAIASECLIYDGNSIEKVKSADIDLIKNHSNIRDRLRNYMAIYKVKNYLKSLNTYDIDLILFEGSLLSNITLPLADRSNLDFKIKKKINKHYLPQISALKENQDVNISHALKNLLKEEFSNRALEAEIYLEGLENLVYTAKMLTKTKNIISISKNSTRSDYFNSNIPDIAVFEYFSKKEGYSKPKYIEISSEKKNFPILNKFFGDLTFTIFYARIEGFKKILKFELPYKAKEEEIKEFLLILKSLSAEGYPFLLKKVHKDVAIKDKDLEKFVNIINLRGKNGREMLR